MALPHFAAAAIHLADYDQTRPESLTRRAVKLVACVKAARRRKEHAITAADHDRVDADLAKLRRQWVQLRAEIAQAEEIEAEAEAQRLTLRAA